MSDNRTPDPAVQVVAEAPCLRWRGIRSCRDRWNGKVHPECAVDALREAGLLKEGERDG